ncbi:MAG TPA: non-canonical purine NTP pyrophosphatase [Methylomirabilota bacterium]|nr:non-canonical purine NTP pyrophosphatase [Methylomirabilota bacterium]
MTAPGPPRLVLATANRAKGAELVALLDGLGYAIETLAAHPGVALPPEGATSYADNALGKARAAAAGTGAVAVGDDSGLEVDALGGEPGPGSARYGGSGLSDAARVGRLLAAVAAAPSRTARFRCVLALVAPWGDEAVVEGVVEGELLRTPRGTGGFGYDPIFRVPGLAGTFGEVSAGDKARVSHRARAAAAARPILARWVTRARAATGA